MKKKPDDPRLTAYALGELEEADRTEIESLLEDSPEARAAVEDVRKTAEMLQEELAGEQGDGLTEAQRKSIERVVQPPRRTRWGALAAVASLLLVVGVSARLILDSAVPALSHSETEHPESKAHPLSSARTSERQMIVSLGYVDGQSNTANAHAVSEDAPQPALSPGVISKLSALGYVSDTLAPGSPTSGQGQWFRSQAQQQPVYLNARSASPDQPDDMPGRTGQEVYESANDSPFLEVSQNPLSTFSIDVDTASYANTRRFINQGALPPRDAVRIEEMINYFDYDYPPPTGDDPFSVNVEIADCPWQPQHRLMRVGLKGRTFEDDIRPACNLVFLIDVSGSMRPWNKLPLLRKALGMLTAGLHDDDRVAMVVYAGSSGLVLPSTSGRDRHVISQALDNLSAGGLTNGGAGIELAYRVAMDNFIEGGVNRVILATDGDFNVGITDQGALVDLLETRARGGVFLTVLGFGMGNLKDATLEKLADKGNGHYAYIDSFSEARKVLVDEIGGTLVTIAKDVKIQIEFNPAEARAYRLIGYTNRLLAARDFNDDTKDAGEIGAGHTVTALYEIVPIGVAAPGTDALRYQPMAAPSDPSSTGELCNVKLRYKEPDGEVSMLIEHPVVDDGYALAESSVDFQFAASVAGFGMVLRGSPYLGDWTPAAVLELAEQGVGGDLRGHRAEFVDLLGRAAELQQ